jgi:FAD/FMN-containing dehydrogenase
MTTLTAPLRDTTSEWQSLRAAVSGRLVTPEDVDWHAVRTPWVVNVDQQPAAILECADAADVVAAVRWAAAHRHPISAQHRGHAARTTLDGALLLRMRRLDAIDISRRTATVGAGVNWGELLARLDDTGLVALAGSNPDPSVVGLVLGGGVSWFTRKHGFTANSVVGFDMVDPQGELVRVTRESDPELFWALRGGGGDFGIVTAVQLELFPAPQLYGGRLLWPIECAAEVLRAFRDLALTAPPELTVWAHLHHFPPRPAVPEPFRGRSLVTIASTFLGEATEAERLLAPLRAAAPVEMDLMGEVSPGTLSRVAGEPTDPTPTLEHSMLLDGLTDDAIDNLVAAFADPATCPLAMVQLRGLGGRFATSSPTDGAVRAVPEPFQLFALGIPAVPELAAPIRAGFAAVDDALGRHLTARRMPNFIGEHEDDASGYDRAALERLRTIKRARDPHGVIRSNKPVLGAVPED